MSIRKLNRISKAIATIIMTIIIFAFLHSETGLFNFDKGNHSTHDYCQIVKNTNTHSQILRDNLPKLELNKDICIHCIDDVKGDDVITSLAISDEHQLFKQSTEVYLFNNTFLI